MFRFAVRRLRWLARIPGAPQLFDALLLTHTAIFHRRRLAAIDAIQSAAQQIPGIRLRVHRLGGIEFTIGDRELGHIHGNGLLDVHLGREEAARCVREGRAEWHHVFGESAWVSYWVRSETDVPGAMILLHATLATGVENAAPQTPLSEAAHRAA
jgi:hypothetical protein